MNYKNIFRLFIMFVVITCSTALFAQTDYSKVKVDQLSDAQVKQMMQRADEMKYTDAQLEQLMSSQGMAADEVSKLRSRVEKIRSEAGSASGGNVDISGRTVNSGGSETSSKPGTAKINSRIFGAELFSNGSITFEPDMRMATPKGYVIGPDDQLLLDITGDNLASYKLNVSPEGYINLEYVG
ncbi:MAG TPA: polysaccharide biosynthesis/export family protein, partial [Niabella sp.]|nr:polysaccharide biosynthesis/export family protein [Niabella sp.]